MSTRVLIKQEDMGENNKKIEGREIDDKIFIHTPIRQKGMGETQIKRTERQKTERKMNRQIQRDRIKMTLTTQHIPFSSRYHSNQDRLIRWQRCGRTHIHTYAHVIT